MRMEEMGSEFDEEDTDENIEAMFRKIAEFEELQLSEGEINAGIVSYRNEHKFKYWSHSENRIVNVTCICRAIGRAKEKERRHRHFERSKTC